MSLAVLASLAAAGCSGSNGRSSSAAPPCSASTPSLVPQLRAGRAARLRRRSRRLRPPGRCPAATCRTPATWPARSPAQRVQAGRGLDRAGVKALGLRDHPGRGQRRGVCPGHGIERDGHPAWPPGRCSGRTTTTRRTAARTASTWPTASCTRRPTTPRSRWTRRPAGQLWTRTLIGNNHEGIDMAPGYRDGTMYVSTVPVNPTVGEYLGNAKGILWALNARPARRSGPGRGAEPVGQPGLNSGGGLWNPPTFDAQGNIYLGIANPGPITAPPVIRGAPAGPARTCTPTRWSSSARRASCSGTTSSRRTTCTTGTCRTRRC